MTVWLLIVVLAVLAYVLADRRMRREPPPPPPMHKRPHDRWCRLPAHYGACSPAPKDVDA